MYFLNVKTVLLGVATASLTAAWPTAILDAASHDPQVLKRAEEEVAKAMQARQSNSASAATSLFEPVPIFDAKAQYIDVSAGSGHEYVPPGPGDLRGPCPGLNALANHVRLLQKTKKKFKITCLNSARLAQTELPTAQWLRDGNAIRRSDDKSRRHGPDARAAPLRRRRRPQRRHPQLVHGRQALARPGGPHRHPG